MTYSTNDTDNLYFFENLRRFEVSSARTCKMTMASPHFFLFFGFAKSFVTPLVTFCSCLDIFLTSIRNLRPLIPQTTIAPPPPPLPPVVGELRLTAYYRPRSVPVHVQYRSTINSRQQPQAIIIHYSSRKRRLPNDTTRHDILKETKSIHEPIKNKIKIKQ